MTSRNGIDWLYMNQGDYQEKRMLWWEKITPVLWNATRLMGRSSNWRRKFSSNLDVKKNNGTIRWLRLHTKNVEEMVSIYQSLLKKSNYRWNGTELIKIKMVSSLIPFYMAELDTMSLQAGKRLQCHLDLTQMVIQFSNGKENNHRKSSSLWVLLRDLSHAQLENKFLQQQIRTWSMKRHKLKNWNKKK